MKSICAVEGVSAAGIKEGKYGITLIKASGNAAAVFTKNLFSAATVIFMKERIKNGYLDGIIVNSGNANVYTGDRGIRDAEKMTEIAAGIFGTTPDRIGVASTGVIGRFLRMDIIEDQCRRIAPSLCNSPGAEDDAAMAIMTTDIVAKHAHYLGKSFTVAGIAKGSGMIAPNMGTMLAFLYTDADVRSSDLNDILLRATERSFNRVVVDGDTSTNDCAFITATGKKGTPDMEEFAFAVESVCISLARQIAADGEGATKRIEVRVINAENEENAAVIAKTVVLSPLVKCAVYGEDPNWGRVLAAAGRAGVDFDPNEIIVSIGNGKEEVILARRGEILADNEVNPGVLALAKKMMAGKEVTFTFDLAQGECEAMAWGCDLTEKYVEINGRYTT